MESFSVSYCPSELYDKPSSKKLISTILKCNGNKSDFDKHILTVHNTEYCNDI